MIYIREKNIKIQDEKDETDENILKELSKANNEEEKKKTNVNWKFFSDILKRTMETSQNQILAQFAIDQNNT